MRFPSKNADFPFRYVAVYQRVTIRDAWNIARQRPFGAYARDGAQRVSRIWIWDIWDWWAGDELRTPGWVTLVNSHRTTRWGPSSLAKLVNITPTTMVYGIYNYG